MTGIDRRHFLRLGGGIALSWALMDRISIAEAAAGHSTTASSIHAAQNILVVAHLVGGNDALATIIDPHQLRKWRRTEPPDGAHTLDGRHVLHPSLPTVAQLWRQQQVAVINGVGVTRNATRSHFQMSDAMMDGGTPGTGWLARWIERDEAIGINPFSHIAITGRPTLMGEGRTRRASQLPAWLHPGVFANTGGDSRTLTALKTLAATSTSPLGKVWQNNVTEAIDAVELLKPVYSQVDTNPESRDWKVAAAAINAQIGVRAVQLDVFGFDTHSDQPTAHSSALARLDAGISALFRNLKPELRSRVAVLVCSEFGRTAQINSAGGSDHGWAGSWLLIGDGVNGGMLGSSVADSTVTSGIWHPAYDVSDVYEAVLDGWMNAGGEYPASTLQLFTSQSNPAQKPPRRPVQG